MSTEQSNATNALQKAKEKTCFIVTPIGGEEEPIRRHIDGIIDAVIHPLLSENGYTIIVPHRVSKPGTITKQIVQDIYYSDLVIVNLTGNNPNVMYELALRHCFNKPLILIAENGTKLPFDILVERTIFYTNDARGVLELRENLSEALLAIVGGTYDGPIHTILRNYQIEETIKAKMDDGKNGEEMMQALSLILNRLDQIDARQAEYDNNRSKNEKIYNRWLRIYPMDSSNESAICLVADVSTVLIPILITKKDVDFGWDQVQNGTVEFKYRAKTKESLYAFVNAIRDFCDKYSYHFEPFTPRRKN